MHNISDKTSLLAVQGPKAIHTLQKLTDIPLEEMPYYTFKKGVFCNIPNVLISNTGYTGAGGFEVYFENEHALTLWNAIMQAGAEFGIKPAGLGCRDTLRLEMGFCLYGNDIDDTTSPIEAGLGWITKFTKTFTNSESLKAQKEAGVTRKLVGFEMTDKGIARHGYAINNSSGQTIGYVTSGTQAPTVGKAIGMGYVAKQFADPGMEIYIQVRDKNLKAMVTKLPFIK
jgi:aminomethyltransferase